MIYERFVVIFICSALSSLATNSSRATELNVRLLNSNDLATSQLNNHPAIAEARTETEHQHKYNFQNYHRTTNLAENQNYLVAQKRQQQPEQQTETPNNLINSEPLPTNRRLLLAAMAITSAMFIYLVWLLFRKPLNHKSAAKLTIVNEPEVYNLKNQSQDDQGKIVTPTYSRLDTAATEKPINHDSEQIPPILAVFNQENFQLDQPGAKHQPASNLVDHAVASNSLIKINSDYIDVVVELIQDLQHSDRNLKRKAIWELAKIGDSRSIEPLAKIIPQAGLVDKSLILKAMTQITNRHFQPINDELFALLKDQNPEIRTNAIRDLTVLYKFVVPVTKQLAQMQQDSDRRVRYAATQALQQLNSGFSSGLDNYPNHGKKHNLALGEQDKSVTNHIKPSRN